MKYRYFLLIFLSILISTLSAEPKTPPRILILLSYHAGYSWEDSITQGIMESFSIWGMEAEFQLEYMDTKQNTGTGYMEEFRKFYHEKNNTADYDGIILCDNNALSFYLLEKDDLFKDIPAVFCGVNNFQPSMIEGVKNITGVTEELEFKRNIELMSKINPRLKKVIIINSSKTTTSKENRRYIDDIMETYNSDLEFEFWNNKTYSEIYSDVEKLYKDTAIFALTYFMDSANIYKSHVQFMKELSSHSSVPIYSPWKFNLKYGITGGYMLEGYNQGELAASLMKSILLGATPEELPVITDAPQQLYLDFEQLTRYNLSKTAIPQGAYLINRPVRFYEKYRPLLFGIFIFLILSFIILSLYIFFQHYKQKLLKVKNSKLNGMVEKRTQELKKANELKGNLLSIITHDLRSPLINLRNLTYLYENYTNMDPEENQHFCELLREKLVRIDDNFETVLKWTRQQLEGKGASIKEYSLSQMINEVYTFLKERFEKKELALVSSIPENLVITTDDDIVKTILRNIMTNALKFSPRKSSIFIQYSRNQKNHIISIIDSGQGIPKEILHKLKQLEQVTSRMGTESEKGSGIGLYLCFKLVENIGGSIEFEKDPDYGARVNLILPPHLPERPR